ncbi:exonuclease subunit SbcD [Edwardsiella piscicida]|uniref:exonuclease subunit SbcD n=1 Tax=Edwardsiella piscicida TaxID=1263550 RepID=UPI002479FD93|nr:exonuclease subunit SbcD [Edwardsiella piscicida]ELM3736012.1 exonuclease subunit SbcD [Edwardsiella piscicida]WGS78069.1 exonuclease subunit SbcD [Edwardsiella piscicida]WGS81456.1 exonuclease subunit SbcD [Edwardsiella piscicida]
MRLIHTSDWHLGQHFYGKSRADEHRAFLDWLLLQAEQQQADAIIVAGDLFDTGTPPSYARELYNRFVVALQGRGCQLIVLAGNHDSVATLNESRELLACLHTQVIAGAHADDAPLLLRRRDGSPGAILCAVPFLRPRDLLQSRAGQSAAEKQLALQQAISDHYHALYQRALALQASLAQPLPIVATGHLTTVGASGSESVRDIYIGTLDALPASAFPPADYIALGHIHRPQRVGHAEHIRYSGSPIPLSFDELGSSKSVCLVTLAYGSAPQITQLPIPQTQPMRLLKGSLTEIGAAMEALRPLATDKPVWLDIEIDSDGWLSESERTLQQQAETLPVEILLLRRSREQRQRALTMQAGETLSELTPDDVFSRRLALEQESDPQQQVRVQRLFQQVLQEITLDPDTEETQA